MSQTNPDTSGRNPADEYRQAQPGYTATDRIPASISDLGSINISPKSTFADDLIELPENWMPGGGGQIYSRRSIRISDCWPAEIDRSLIRSHELAVRRALYALWYIPRFKAARYRKPLAPSTFCARARGIIWMAQWSFRNRFHPDTLFAHLTNDDLKAMLGERKRISLVINDLQYYGVAKILTDVPPVHRVAASTHEASRKGAKAETLPQQESKAYQPFPDDFISEFGWRCLWIINNLGPQLLHVQEQLSTPGIVDLPKRQRRDCQQHILRAVKWRDSQGQELESIPFDIAFGIKRVDHSFGWPPQSAPEMAALLSMLQTSHFVVLALSIGARWSECSASEADFLSETDQSTFRTRTFKFADRIGGEQRDFPLPLEAVKALIQQSELARGFHQQVAGPLFVLRKRKGERQPGDRLHEMNAPLQRLVEALSLAPLLGDSAAHTHRFRKTVARLIGLALVDAPKILFDLFGHKSMMMTLSYMLSDKQMLAELLDVADRTAHAMTGDVIANLDACSGPAAPKLQKAMKTFVLQSGKERFDTETIEEAVDVLSVTGVPFKIVRPGVLCTKQPTQRGACDPDSPDPNPARCRPECDHRLELASAKIQVDSAISYICAKLEGEPEMADLPRANWHGQLLHHLQRFSDVREKWLRQSATAATVWADRQVA
jgi:hypothetical protein